MIFRFLLYFALIGLSWIFRSLYIGWFGPFLFYIVLLAPIILFFLSLPSILSLQTSIHAPKRANCHTETDFSFHFSNSRKLPVQKIIIRMEICNSFNGERYTRKYIFRQISNEQYSFSLPTDLCGELQCRLLSVTCFDCLSLFFIQKKTNSSFRCIVMPLPVESTNPIQLDSVLNTPSVLIPKYGGGYSEDHDLREYRPGDPVNSIHWKLSSKTDAAIVREPLIPENDTIYVILSRVGEEDLGLGVLFWLSGLLLDHNISHVVVSSVLYTVNDDYSRNEAMAEILSTPMQEPCSINPMNARCIFLVSSGEVRCL